MSKRIVLSIFEITCRYILKKHILMQKIIRSVQGFYVLQEQVPCNPKLLATIRKINV